MGLTTVQKVKHKKRSTKQTTQQLHSRYIPPDEVLRMKKEELAGSSRSFSDRVKVTSEDIPIRIVLNQDGIIRKRAGNVVSDRNPNNYDYDLDELIRDETKGEADRSAAKYYAKEKLEINSEELV